MPPPIRLIVPVLVAALAPAVQAVTTYSPTIRSSEGNRFVCTAQNLGRAALDVEAIIDNGQGGSVGSMTMSVPPGDTRVIMASTAAIFGGFCEFNFDGDPNLVRGVYTREAAAGGDTQLALVASPVPEGGAAVETVLVTPPINSADGGNFGCQAQNLSGAVVEVVGEVHDNLGAILDDGTVMLPAGQARQVAAVAVTAVPYGYCILRFTAPPGQVRGFATLQPAGGGDTRAIIEALALRSDAPVTATPTEPPPTAATATPTAVETGGPACCGDCNLDGVVAINELITAVNYALESCP